MLDELRDVIRSSLDIPVTREYKPAAPNQKDSELLTALSIFSLSINCFCVLCSILKDWSKEHPNYKVVLCVDSQKYRFEQFDTAQLSNPSPPGNSVVEVALYIHKVPKHLVICHHQEDEPLRRALLSHLDPLVREGFATVWDMTKVGIGINEQTEIEAQVGRADMLLLLVSAPFLQNAPWRNWIELTKLRASPTDIVPLLARPALWRQGELAQLRCLPGNGIPVTHWPHPDQAWHDVASALLSRIQHCPAMTVEPPESKSAMLRCPSTRGRDA